MKLKVVNVVVEIEASEIEESLLIKYIEQKMFEAVSESDVSSDSMLNQIRGTMDAYREGWL